MLKANTPFIGTAHRISPLSDHAYTNSIEKPYFNSKSSLQSSEQGVVNEMSGDVPLHKLDHGLSDPELSDSQDSLSTNTVCITPTPLSKNGRTESTSSNSVQKSAHCPGQAVPATVPSSLLLRLFESDLFNMDLALQYLHSTHDLPTQRYLAGRMLSFSDNDVDFYMPQIVTLCHQNPLTCNILNHYMMQRCVKSLEFSMNLSWLLESHDQSEVAHLPKAPRVSQTGSSALPLETGRSSLDHKTDAEEKADADDVKSSELSDGMNSDTGEESTPRNLAECSVYRKPADFPATYVEAIDEAGPAAPEENVPANPSIECAPHPCSICCLSLSNVYEASGPVGGGQFAPQGQTQLEARATCPCHCHPKDEPTKSLNLASLKSEVDFMRSLFEIAKRLTKHKSKEQRSSLLSAELATLNLKLPARVWLPVNKRRHIVLRIPPNAAVCLNSKDRAPYLVYVEVLECDDVASVRLPSRSGLSSCATSISSLASEAQSKLDGWKVTATTGLSALFSALKPHASTHNLPTPGSKQCAAFGSALAIAAPDALSVLSTESGNSSQPSTEESKCHAPSPPGQAERTEESSPVSFVSAGQIRQRLKDYSDSFPKRTFQADPDDPSAAVLKEPWELKWNRIKNRSPWGHLPGWRLTAAIVKVGDDLRQEQLAYQLLHKLQRVWRDEQVELWLRPLEIVATSADAGLIEPVPDTVSFHQIRRHAKLSLLDYMIREHGSMKSAGFVRAQRNFVQSCAAYCLVGYLFQVKDRHNGNILLDSKGHVIHIDFGFMLSASPGKNLGFETSPFKLTHEQVAVMGGLHSEAFAYYKELILRGLLAARKHMDEVCVMVEIQRQGHPRLPCFARGGRAALDALRQRFQLSRTEEQLRAFVLAMVDASLHSLTTRLYDSFQYYTNGIQ